MKDCFVNNHIHTTYSFSPYSPAQAVAAAVKAGLKTCGIMDHDSIAGAREFIAAGRELDIPVTVGLETRVTVKGTFLENICINNPDQNGCAYVAMHGVPHQNIEKLDAVFAKVRAERNKRNRLMVKKLDEYLGQYGISVDFEKDVLPFSLFDKGGTVTERTVCAVAAKNIIDKFGRGAGLIGFLKNILKLDVPEKIEAWLSDIDSPHYFYDVLGVLKSGLVSVFYIGAEKECMDINAFTALARETGAIAAYAYLGDITASVTGDKKAQAFEDGYLDELFTFIKDAGFNAVTYMPSRNTPEQLKRIRALCKEHGFFEISGEDINSSRQSFICPALERPEFAHLIEATYALIGHEKAATKNVENGMFTEKTVKKMPELERRIAYFSKIGKGETE